MIDNVIDQSQNTIGVPAEALGQYSALSGRISSYPP